MAEIKLPAFVRDKAYSDSEIRIRSRQIYESVIADSPAITRGNFTNIAVADLYSMFGLYDEQFFTGLVNRRMAETGHTLHLRLSRRMTRSGGLTTFIKRRSDGKIKPESPIDIAFSLELLGRTFHDVNRTVMVNGITCSDRLEALQRLFEHELIHLVEVLAWGDSTCSAPRFSAISRRIFGHTDVTHALVTQAERAVKLFDIAVGDSVSLTFEGRRFTGKVNSITKRATVLVEDASGVAYTDGRRYQKYYVPLAFLEKNTGPSNG